MSFSNSGYISGADIGFECNEVLPPSPPPDPDVAEKSMLGWRYFVKMDFTKDAIFRMYLADVKRQSRVPYAITITPTGKLKKFVKLDYDLIKCSLDDQLQMLLIREVDNTCHYHGILSQYSIPYMRRVCHEHKLSFYCSPIDNMKVWIKYLLKSKPKDFFVSWSPYFEQEMTGRIPSRKQQKRHHKF